MNNATMPFGKHKGKNLDDIPQDYLRWCLRSLSLYEETRTAIEASLRSRKLNEGNTGESGAKSRPQRQARQMTPPPNDDIPF